METGAGTGGGAIISRGGSAAAALTDLLRVCPPEKAFAGVREALLFLSLIASDQLKPSPTDMLAVIANGFK